MKNIVLAFGLVFMLLGCVNHGEDDNIEEYNIIEVPLVLKSGNSLCFSIEQEPLTRAPITVEATEDEFHNVWVFQFENASDEAKLVKAPFYIDNDEISDAIANGRDIIMLLVESNTPNRLVFVANINNRNYSWNLFPNQSTYLDLKSRIITLDGASDESRTYGASNSNVVMSGTAVSTISSAIKIDGDDDESDNDGGGVELYRSLAKIKLNLSIDSTTADGCEVKSIKLRNISNRLNILHELMGLSETDIYPNESEVTTIDYALESISGLTSVSGQNNRTFIWYVPRNSRGAYPESSSPKTKNLYAPKNSTYIEIHATYDSGTRGVIYRVYPGANSYNDFNILPNNEYVLNLTIEGDGGDFLDDSRIERMDSFVFTGNSNSFIINPPIAGMPKKIISIPITRINEYWGKNFPGYGGMIDNVIKDDDTWTAELLWQDKPAIVRSSGGDPNSNIILHKNSGQGGEDVFSLIVPAAAERGNFVIAVKKDSSSDILWSWHFWVTDYDPTPDNVFITANEWTYDVPGGLICRMGGSYWGYNTAGANRSNWWNNYSYKGEVSVASPMAKGFIMDRLLGSSTPNERAPLTYQWGRKDPFPSPNLPTFSVLSYYTPPKLYDISGALITYSESANAISSPYSVAESVKNPLVFFTVTNNQEDWSGLNDNVSLWNDVTKPINNKTEHDLRFREGRFGKSIFDPCPPGWVMPLLSDGAPMIFTPTPEGPWHDMLVNNTINNPSRGLIWAKLTSDPTHGFCPYWPLYKTEDGFYPIPQSDRLIYFKGFRAMRKFNEGNIRLHADASWVPGVTMMLAEPNPNNAGMGTRMFLHTSSGHSSVGVFFSDSKSTSGPVRCVTYNYYDNYK